MTSENWYEETESQKISLEESPRGLLIRAPSPGKDHLFGSVPYQATAGRLQLVQAFTVFQVTTVVQDAFELATKAEDEVAQVPVLPCLGPVSTPYRVKDSWKRYLLLNYSLLFPENTGAHNVEKNHYNRLT